MYMCMYMYMRTKGAEFSKVFQCFCLRLWVPRVLGAYKVVYRASIV